MGTTGEGNKSVAQKTRPAKIVDSEDTGQAIRIGSRDWAIYVWPDDRGGVNVEADSSIIVHPRNGTSLRVITGREDYATKTS